jgi:hypothetical protein
MAALGTPITRDLGRTPAKRPSAEVPTLTRHRVQAFSAPKPLSTLRYCDTRSLYRGGALDRNARRRYAATLV